MRAPQTNSDAGSISGSDIDFGRESARRAFSPWCSSRTKRAFDLLVVMFALIAIWPIFLLIAAGIRISSPGPVFFRQLRVGKQGRLFWLLKFRSMRISAERSGPRITAAHDPRVFPVGRIIRRWKLDELPQMLNVLQGEMSLVGPRPDLPEFCDTLDSDRRRVLDLRPGVTGAATLAYRDEEKMLAEQGDRNITHYYIATLYPEKIRLDLEYARRATFLSDLEILARTGVSIIS